MSSFYFLQEVGFFLEAVILYIYIFFIKIIEVFEFK